MVASYVAWRVASQQATCRCRRPRGLQALGLRPEDVFTAEMLAEAMEESSLAFEEELMQQQQGAT